MNIKSPLTLFILGCVTVLSTASVTSSKGQPVILFEKAPPIEQLVEPGGRGYSVPEGDWTKYRAWLAQGRPPSGPVVAIIDSGVLSVHPFIRPVLRNMIDLTGEDPEDRVGHGTFVTLLYLMSVGEGVGPLVSIKVHGGNQTPSGSDLMARALQRAGAEGAQVVNVSAGVFLECANARDPTANPFLLKCEDTPICRAVEELRLKNTLVIAAVGNSPGKTGCPACCKSALAIGAADENGQIAAYSGAFPDILAPGSFRAVPLRRAEP